MHRREFLKNVVACGAFGALALRDDALVRVQAAQKRADGRAPTDVAADEDYWFDIQQAFAVDRSLINLNNGGVSPAPRIVQEAMRRHLEYMNQAPVRNMWTHQDPQVEHVRARLAHAFGASPDEIAITRNASEALETCLLGAPLAAGDEVLTTELDYPRMLNTIRQRAQREGVVLKTIPIQVPVQSADEVVNAFRAGITDRTRLILCCHVIFVTGQIFPVREICRLGRERGIPVVVDGAHAFAHIPFHRDDLECDYYGASLHKWLTAPVGTGMLYVRRERIASIWPLMAAPEGMADSIRKFEEIGTHPAANRLAIAEALLLYEALGGPRKAARLRYLRDRWARRLALDPRVSFCTRLEPEHGCGFATLRIEGVDPQKLATYLWERHKIIVVAIDYANVQGIRVSPNVYTTVGEIDQFASAIENVLANGLPS